MKDITLSDIPCLKDYEEVKKRLFVRLWNKERLQENGTIYEPFQNLYFSCHIDVSDLAGVAAFCMVKERYAECLGVDRKQLLADAVENGVNVKHFFTSYGKKFCNCSAPLTAHNGEIDLWRELCTLHEMPILKA